MGQQGMGSVDKLAFGSALCGCIAIVLSCLVLSAILVIGYLTEAFPVLGFFLLGLLITAIVMGLIGVALGVAALIDLSQTSSGEQRRYTQARVGITFGVAPLLLTCLLVVFFV